MALCIKDLADLKLYLETRMKMAQNQQQSTIKDTTRVAGMVYAYSESIKAVEALMSGQQLPDETNQAM